MKTIFKILSISILCGFITTTLIAEKHALIIAIGDYPDEGGWPDISSQNDVIHISEALRVLGFSADNIITLRDAEASKVNILKTLESINSKLKKGDIVYIHFSGHGQQIFDDNGDEIDKLDESIVPYDSPLEYEKGVYEGERLIRDDELGKFTDKLRLKCGPNGQVILILDSCHSGSGTRGMGKARGTNKIMAPDDFKSITSSKEKKMGIVRDQSENMAPMASFFGASSRELNYETLDSESNPVGSLSYALSTTLATMETNYTFDELFQRIKLKMKATAPRQNPQWEGPKNTVLFGGQLDLNDKYHSVIEVLNTQELKINVGTLQEVFVGTEVAVYDYNDEKIISKGFVSNASLKEALIKLETALPNIEGLYKVKITEKAHAPVQCLVANQIANTHPKYKLVSEVLENPVVLNIEENADLFISSCDDGSSVQVTAKDGTILYLSEDKGLSDKQIKYDINKVIRAYTQGKFIKSYDSNNDKYNLKLEIVQVDPNQDTRVIKTLSGEDEISMKIGSCLKFKISNNGTRGAYFTLLDIQPDNAINLLIPAIELNYTAEEYYLEAGQSYITDYVIEIGEPLGEETLKLISSKSPMDLSGIIRTNGMSTRGVINPQPFETLFASTYGELSTRGAKVRKSKIEDVGTQTIFFTIEK